MLEELAALVDTDLYPRSGSVFYSGRTAFSAPSPIYVLGLNPGGDPQQQASETIGRQLNLVVEKTPSLWSAYCDDSWAGRAPGSSTFQRRMHHLFSRIGADPRRTPSSNLIFVRSRRKACLNGEWDALADVCWRFHEQVVARMGIRIIICLGKGAGKEVRRRVGAYTRIDTFKERNEREWESSLHENVDGLLVASLTHPSIADWTTPQCDPCSIISLAIDRCSAQAFSSGPKVSPA